MEPFTPWHPVIIGLLLWLAPAPAAGTLSVKLVDDRDVPTPARVYLFDSAGVAHAPSGTIVYDKSNSNGFSERHFVPPTGSFGVDLPMGRYGLVVERGKEFEPLEEQIDIPAAGDVARNLKIVRWADMAARGWYSADMHVHRPLGQLATLMEAEDLNVPIPLSRWRFAGKPNEDPDLPAFLLRADPAGMLKLGDHRFASVLNEELESRDSASLVSNLGRERSPLAYPLAAYGHMARQRGAVVDIEKPTALEMPVIAALGACDALGLANNHLWRNGGYFGAWGAWPDGLLAEYPARRPALPARDWISTRCC